MADTPSLAGPSARRNRAAAVSPETTSGMRECGPAARYLPEKDYLYLIRSLFWIENVLDGITACAICAVFAFHSFINRFTDSFVLKDQCLSVNHSSPRAKFTNRPDITSFSTVLFIDMNSKKVEWGRM